MTSQSKGDFIFLQIDQDENNTPHRQRHDSQKGKHGENYSVCNKMDNWKIETPTLKFQRHVEPWGQKYNWDCGIACAAMCLPVCERRKLYINLPHLRDEFGFDTSIWTIDLCYILQTLKKSFVFVTNFAGVNPELKYYRFYSKILNKDTERVYKRFSEAVDFGISITVKTISLEEILENVLVSGPAIVLTNGNLLDCLDCPWTLHSCVRLSCCLRKCFQGHYVLLTGFDLKNGHVYYNNPSYADRTCRMNLKDFDRARRAIGTDCDAILIKNDEYD